MKLHHVRRMLRAGDDERSVNSSMLSHSRLIGRLSTVVLAELLSGVAFGARQARNREELRRFPATTSGLRSPAWSLGPCCSALISTSIWRTA